ncbi:MAG: O-acetyl-ADP-ribose deacetylase [Acidobacteriota bacterium]
MSAGKVEVIQGDITKQQVDAIVNAANSSLLGGGGVDGAIHQAAGPKLLEECRKLKGCHTGEAKITNGYNLPARWVIHTVGPIWRGGSNNEDELLASAYRNSLALTLQHSINTIAFPSISTGAYNFPIERAAKIAMTQFKQFLATNSSLKKILMVCFSRSDYQTYSKTAYEILEK